MKIFKVLLFTGILLLLGNNASYAQKDSLKNELGFGTNILFHNFLNSTSSPFDFIYRRHSGKGLWRLGGSIGFRNDEELRDAGTNFEKRIDVTVNPGKEWRAPVAKNWQLNYGGDLIASFFLLEKKSRYQDRIEKRESYNYSKEQKYGLGLRAFVGIGFQLNKRLSVWTEASVSSLYQKIYYNEHGFSAVQGKVTYREYPGNGEGWKMLFHSSPASNIFFYYRF